jgi:hypothetical protein
VFVCDQVPDQAVVSALDAAQCVLQ